MKFLYIFFFCSAETQNPPSLSTLYNLFTSSSPTQTTSSPIKSILFAIVDGSNISFLEYNDVMFENIHVNLISDNI